MEVEINFVEKINENTINSLLEISKNDGGRPVSESWLRKISERDVFFIAFVKDIPIAFAAVDPWFKYDKEGVELDIISVRKEFQRKGIGKKLMENVEKYAKKLGKKYVYLFVSSSNFGARIFYAKLGFEIAGLLTDRYGVGKHSVIIRKTIKI